MNTGFIAIHRKITDHWVWQDKPFTYGQAWIDLIILCNHKDNKFFLNHHMKHCKRGSLYRSVGGLSERWGWSNTKTRKFLQRLIDDEMIETLPDTTGTMIMLTNYDKYQKHRKQEDIHAEANKYKQKITI